MNTYIIYFVSVINCYVSAQLIFDHLYQILTLYIHKNGFII